LRDLYWNVVYNEIDAILIITGRERFGKSTLAMIIWAYLDELRHEWGLPPTINLQKKVSYIPEDYARNIDRSEGVPGDVVFYDEAGTGMYNRESMSKGNVSLNKILMTCGYKNLVHILNLPNFFALDKEVRARRVASLFVVTAHPRKVMFKGQSVVKLEKGWFRSYSAKDVQMIYKDSRTSKVHYPRTPHGDLRFKSLEGTQLWQEYETYSNKHKQKFIKRVAADILQSRRKSMKVETVATLDEFNEEERNLEGFAIQASTPNKPIQESRCDREHSLSANAIDEDIEIIEGNSI